MPRLALKIDPRASIQDLHRQADRWEVLLDRSARPLETARTVLPGFAAVNLLLGFFRNRPQPARSADGTVYLLLDGEIWDREAARQYAGGSAREDPSDPELCLRLYLRWGDTFCERLNGQFVVAIYDSGRGRLLVCNDRHAFRPLFWRAVGDTFICGSEVKAVLSAVGRCELDPAGVLELFAYGQQLGARTLFEGVQALPPASRLIYERGVTRLETYWRFDLTPAAESTRDEELREELARRLRRAGDRQAGGAGRLGVALDGELESQLVLAALGGCSDSLSCTFTLMDGTSTEAVRARLLAEATELRHLELEPAPGSLRASSAEAVWRTEGALPVHAAFPLQFHSRLRPELDIIQQPDAAAPLFRADAGIAPGPGAQADPVECFLQRSLHLPLGELSRLFSRRVWTEQIKASRASVEAAVGADAHLVDPQALQTVLAMRCRQPRASYHLAQVDRYDFEVRSPLLDYELLDFLSSLPRRHAGMRSLGQATLAAHFPSVALHRRPRFRGVFPGVASGMAGRASSRLSAELLRLVPGVSPRPAPRRETPSARHARELLRDGTLLQEVVRPFVRGDSFPDGLLDRDTALELLESHRCGARCHPITLSALATLALVYRHFLEHGLQAPAPPRGYPEPVPALEAA